MAVPGSEWPLVICFPRPLLLYHVDAQPHPLSPIVLSPGFALSVLVYFFLQGNTDAISPMMSSLIPPSLNLYSTKYQYHVTLALDHIKPFFFFDQKKGLLQGPTKENRWAYAQKKSHTYICMRHYFANKGPSSQSYDFSSSHIWM